MESHFQQILHLPVHIPPVLRGSRALSELSMLACPAQGAGSQKEAGSEVGAGQMQARQQPNASPCSQKVRQSRLEPALGVEGSPPSCQL